MTKRMIERERFDLIFLKYLFKKNFDYIWTRYKLKITVLQLTKRLIFTF